MSNLEIDPKEWLDAVDARWNEHDLEGAMEFFTPDATAEFVPPLPNAPTVYKGKDAILAVIQGILPGFQVESYNHRLDDNRLIWKATASADMFRRLGLDTVSANGEAILSLEDERTSSGRPRMQSFKITFTPETVSRMQAAMQAAR
jgi:hypothetical protein